jgi:hypothetical protein
VQHQPTAFGPATDIDYYSHYHSLYKHASHSARR